MQAVLLVVVQFVLIALLIWPGSELRFLWPALLLALPALALAVWTLFFNRLGNFNIRPTLKAGAHLVTEGPYAWVRHPMYVCVLWMGLAAVVLYASWLKLTVLIALAGVLWFKAAVEEKILRLSFPQYEDYAFRVPRFIPSRRPHLF